MVDVYVPSQQQQQIQSGVEPEILVVSGQVVNQTPIVVVGQDITPIYGANSVQQQTATKSDLQQQTSNQNQQPQQNGNNQDHQQSSSTQSEQQTGQKSSTGYSMDMAGITSMMNDVTKTVNGYSTNQKTMQTSFSQMKKSVQTLLSTVKQIFGMCGK